MFYFTTLLAGLSSLKIVSAALYATKPWSETVYSAGQTGEISWVDDGTYPRLQNIGPLKIDLLDEYDTFVTTLATNVNPLARSHTVTFPQIASGNSSEYMLLFTSDSPPVTFYTADFSITPSAANSTGNSTHNQTTSSAQQLTLVLPSTTLVTQLASAQTHPSAVQTVYAPPIGSGDSGQAHAYCNGQSASQRIDLEKMKFRLVFIVWPALVGITMAM